VRKWLVLGSFLLSVAVAAGVLPGSATPRTTKTTTLTYVGWGGSFQDAQMNAWIKPYMKAHPNVKIVQDSPTDYAKIKAMAESHNVTWDVVDVSNDYGIKTGGKSLEKLNCKIIACKQLISRFSTGGYRAPMSQFATVLAYRKDKINGTPQNWKDFFNTKKYPGKRAVYKWASNSFFEVALLGDGVSPKRLYPLDVKRALRKWDSIKSDIIWWDTGAQSQQLLQDGEAVMCDCWNGRMYDSQKQGSPIGVQWNQELVGADYLVVPKGTKNKDAAMRFIAYVVSANNNARLSKYISYGPTNRLALKKVSAKIKPFLPSTHASQAVYFNDAWWDANYARVNDQFQAWLQK